jgi:Pyruvate/2-oxoacid:ferredoxin oxidoreductase gamma subunit
MSRIPLRKAAKDISIVLCGAAGQGVQTVEELLIGAFRQAGYSVFASREYMSRVRGGKQFYRNQNIFVANTGLC